MAAKRRVTLLTAGRVESLLREDLEGILVIDDRLAHFKWYANGDRAGRRIEFFRADGSTEVDPQWVRSVCQSLRFAGQMFPRPVSETEILSLLRIGSK